MIFLQLNPEMIFLFKVANNFALISLAIRWAKCFYKKIVSNQMHFQIPRMMFLMRSLEKMMAFYWPGSIQLFFGSDTRWIQFDHSVDVVCIFQGMHTFHILLQLFCILLISFSLHLTFLTISFAVILVLIILK